MKCHACNILAFQPLDKVQKLALSQSSLDQTLGTSLAISRKAVTVAASSAKGLNWGIKNALAVLPPTFRSNIGQPGNVDTLHNSVYVLHPNLESLELSAAAGCEFCRLIWGGLKAACPQESYEKRDISEDVRLYLSAYRSFGPERSLSRLTDQYITVECGPERSMSLEITAAAVEPLKAPSPARARDALLNRAVRGFPNTKLNKNGTVKVDLNHVDLNKLDFKLGHGKPGHTNIGLSVNQKGKTRGQMVANLEVMNSLHGAVEQTSDYAVSELDDEHTGSKANMRRAIAWLNICLRTHDVCTYTTDSYTPLPTRVIDLGPPNGSQTPYIYRSNGEHARYCTLSHRWAGNSVVKTTTENLWLHETHLPLHDLSTTFIEAIEVCRELCVRYLWIDSLCIIQDSREDWEIESSKMGSYYWNSFFTIAADHATEEYQGCFRWRDPCEIQPCFVAFTFPQDINMFIGGARVTPRIQEKTDWRHKPYSILDTRSWILQERILSPRTLFFGEHQLSFSCTSMRASENIPEGLDRSAMKVQAPFEEFQRKIRFNAISSTHQASSPFESASTQWPASIVKINPQLGQVLTSIDPQADMPVHPHLRDLYDNWYDLLIEYNKRSITQTNDVLPAISGLAIRFQQTIGDTYLAGLWSGDLKGGLLWSVDGTAQRSTTYRAPSWSWASLRACRLRMNYIHDNVTNANLCDIYNVDVKTRGANAFGEVVQGELYVKGFLKKAIAISPPKYIDIELNRNEEPDKDVRYGEDGDPAFRELVDNLHMEEGKTAFLQDPGSGEQLSHYNPDGVSDYNPQEVWCLPLVIQKGIFGAETALSLVLKPSPWEQGRWYRVGFARILKLDWFGDSESCDIVIV
ncbi:hypothetical protein BP5796_11993 [Coleophoma crateriformis]|uniref:Heterokaryon incompatibility domain-containing protein n=1 Tax=Coleophoma crateriformis TaxID=565419 RepID=A0A3D8QBC3_9HELO|nr:hypothetical protein BP5796_11993 [Coleophoma crateriformis]